MIEIMVLGLRGITDVQGGVEKHVEQIYRRLAQLGGYRIEVIARHPYYHPDPGLPENIKVVPIWSPRRTGVEAFVHTFIAVLYAAIKRPDVLHIHAIGPGIFTSLARIFGLRVLFTHHGFDYEREKWGWFARCLLKIGEGLALRCSHSVIAVSEVAASRLRHRYRRPVNVIKNGAEFAGQAAKPDVLGKFGVSARRYAISVARVIPEKRQRDIVEAYIGLAEPEFDLVIVGGDGGDSDYYHRLVSLAERYPRVRMTGFLSGEPLDQLMINAGCFVLASSHEGFSVAALEAINYRVPLLLSDIPANREFALDGDCYFPLGDTDRLGARLTELMSAEIDDARLQRRRDEFARRYSWDAIALETQGAIAALIDS